MLVGLPLIYTLLNATFNGLMWTTNIGGAIAHQRLRNNYDVLCLIPDGPLTVNWIISTEQLHYNKSLERSLGDVGVVTQIMSVIVVFLLIGVVSAPGPQVRLEILRMLIVVVSLVTLIIIDYIQSVVTGSLIGMLIANLTRNVMDSRMWSFAVFLSVQFFIYVTLLLLLFLSPALAPGSETGVTLLELIMPVVVVLLIVGLREFIIFVLWRWLIQILNVENSVGTIYQYH